MINWMATARTIAQHESAHGLLLVHWNIYPVAYSIIISQIYVPNDVVRLVLQKMNRNFRDIVECEEDPGLGNGGLGTPCFLSSGFVGNPPLSCTRRMDCAINMEFLNSRFGMECRSKRLTAGCSMKILGNFAAISGGCMSNFAVPRRQRLISMAMKSWNWMNPEEVGALPYDYPIVGYSKDRDFSVVTFVYGRPKILRAISSCSATMPARLDQAAENTTLTDVLYPSDYTEMGKRVRLKQEFLLVSASLQDIIRHILAISHNFRQFADKVRIQINDTHPVFGHCRVDPHPDQASRHSLENSL